MAKSCAIIPAVLNKDGKKVDSKLFKDLLSYLPRPEAVRIYEITKSEKFKQEVMPRLKLDDNNEPTIPDLLKYTSLYKSIPEATIINKLKRDIGHYNKETGKPKQWSTIESNYKKLIAKAIQFNTTSEYRENYVARVIKGVDREYNKEFFTITIEKRNTMNSLDASNMEYNEALNNRLKDILAYHGISIGALTELEKRLGISGVTDFSVAKESANGIIQLIRLAEGVKGEKALPEEFAHFALEALGDNPLVTRLLNTISNDGVIQEILGEEYDTYYTSYNGDKLKLAKEAAGKLLAKHLLQEFEIPNKPYKNLLQRVITSIKNFFRNIKASEIQKAIYQADKDLGSIARGILSGQLNDSIKRENITETEMFYNLADRVQRDRELLRKLINQELKRLKIYQSRYPEGDITLNQQKLIQDLERSLAEHNEIEGIYSFIDNAISECRVLDARITILQNSPGMGNNEKARLLREIRNSYNSYSTIIDTIREASVNEKKFSDDRYRLKINEALDTLEVVLKNLNASYLDISGSLFENVVAPFIGDDLVVPFGKRAGEKITIKEVIEEARKDIGLFDRLLDSMADSSSILLKVFDRLVKNQKEKARLNTIEMSKRIQEATIKLEQSGVRNTDWMFERDSEGNMTDSYISEINYGEFKLAKSKIDEELIDKYGENPSGENLRLYIAERKEWLNNNTEYVKGKIIPKKSIYGNKVFASLNKAQKEYYDAIMSIKEELDSLLPKNTTKLLNTIKIRKDLLERIKSSPGDIKKHLKEAIADQFVVRSDDTDFVTSTLLDFNGDELRRLPIYYIKRQEGENPNDLSTDVTSTLIAYASMVYDFSEMNKVIDSLEVGRDYIDNKLKVPKTTPNKWLKEKFNILGKEVENIAYKKKGDRRIVSRLNDFFEMQVYGRYMKDEGTFGKTNISVGKTANVINRLTSLNNIALNLLLGISNAATGSVMMRIEGIAGNFFKQKDVIEADRLYGKNLPSLLAELGDRVKTNKLALWEEKFNVLQEYDTNIKNVQFDRKSWFSKMFSTSSLFFMSNAGEHWMQLRTSLALASAYKMKSPSGKIVNLWDAMEVVYKDPRNTKLGATLEIKEGYTKLDGTEFTTQDIADFTRKSAGVNQRMHGIYNKADRNAFQRLAVGRLAMMYRNWIVPSFNRRFGGVTYNFDVQEWTEGYYATSWRFLTKIIEDLKEGQFNIAANFKSLDQREKNNIKAALTEISHFAILSIILRFIEWPDDNEDTWITNMLEYQCRRLKTELGVMIPGPSMLNEGLKIVKSPAAGVNTIDNLMGLFGLLNPFNYELISGEEALLKSGRYKGESKATKLFYESPIVPMNKTIYKVLHPEEGIPFYKQ